MAINKIAIQAAHAGPMARLFWFRRRIVIARCSILCIKMVLFFGAMRSPTNRALSENPKRGIEKPDPACQILNFKSSWNGAFVVAGAHEGSMQKKGSHRKRSGRHARAAFRRRSGN
ncbi:MAG: hypothetical protein Q9P14_08705 [candidate division KSB1 bacterium]|nr:hypothetical protein [candidate division KSB1 bacterium]MDQ7063290.1 hypothetical protein [candidate division KSB1 bacterium]